MFDALTTNEEVGTMAGNDPGEAIGFSWGAEMRVDRVQEDADWRVARSRLRMELDALGSARAELARELRHYPLVDGSSHARAVPHRAGELPPKLERLLRAASEEARRQSLPGPDAVPAVVDGPALVGTKGEWALNQAVARAYQRRLAAPATMARSRRIQSAVDEMYRPEPRERSTQGWRL